MSVIDFALPRGVQTTSTREAIGGLGRVQRIYHAQVVAYGKLQQVRYYRAIDGYWVGPRRREIDTAVRDLNKFQAHRERDPHCSCSACCEYLG